MKKPETPTASETQPQRTLRQARSLLVEIEALIPHAVGSARRNAEVARNTAHIAAMLAAKAQQLGEAGDLDQAVGALAQANDGLRAAERCYRCALIQRLEPAILTGVKTRERLDTGRPAGVKARQRTSQEKLTMLERAITDLRKNPASAAMTNQQITDFLLERNLSHYSRASTLRHVNSIAARLRNPSCG